MTWDTAASAHIGEQHRLTLRSLHEIRCHTCAMTLVVPKEPKALSRSGPPPYRRPDNPGRPMPTGLKERVAAEIAARKRMKDTS